MSPARSPRLDWILFVTLGFLWGSSYLWIKIAVEEGVTPFILIAGRLLIGLSLLSIFLWRSKITLPRERRMYGHLMVMGVINIALPFFLITWGEQAIDSALASILNSTVPLLTIVLAAFLLHDEPATLNRLIGVVVGFAGVFVITSPSLAGAPDANLLAELAILGSSLCYAIGAIYARHNVRGLEPMVPAFFQVFFALIVTGAAALLVESPTDIPLTPPAILAILWLGLLGSGFAYPIFFGLLKRWGPTRVSMVAYTLPIWGISLGFLVLAEPIDGRIIAGTALIISGIALVNSRWGRRRIFGRTPATETEIAAP
ncbi:MAG TPA: DMT family transporter [Candidatus Limnocylindrales bacterium]|nr:DMT family transporter [Candidatus Limnocylindrales bacterium]